MKFRTIFYLTICLLVLTSCFSTTNQFLEAVSDNDVQKVKNLIDKGVDITTADEFGQDAMFRAAYRGHEDIVKILIDNGIDVNKKSKGIQPIYLAAQEGHINIIKTLVESGADVDAATHFGYTALYTASRHIHYDIVKYLIQNNANTELKCNNGLTPLMGIFNYDPEIFLMRHESVEIVDGKQVFNLGNIYDDIHDLAEMLIKNGADVNSASDAGITPIHLASFYPTDVTSFIKLLYENGADINVKNNYGDTPLLISAKKGFIKNFNFFLENGANINEYTKDNESLLFLAVYSDEIEMVKNVLQLKKIDINHQTNEGKTALMLAVENDNYEIVKRIIESGADVNIRTSDSGYTALMFAAEKAKRAIARLLVENGAELDIVNNQKYTALKLARRNMNVDVVKYLESLNKK